MFNIGDTVMHPGSGVCKITDIVTQKFMRTEERTYYVLKAVYDTANTTIYCPVDNDCIKLRKLLTEDDIRKIIHNLDFSQSLWVDNDTERKKTFAAILRESDHSKIIRLITELHLHMEQKQKEGKKLHLADEKIMHEAEKTIQQELAYSMKMNVDEVADFIIGELAKIKK